MRDRTPFAALADIAKSNLQGWLEPQPSQEALNQSKQRALEMGAEK